MQLSKLRRRNRRRGIKHEVHSVLILGEGDNLPDIALSGEQHHQPVYPGGYASMRRRATLEGFQQMLEPGLGLLFAIT